MANWYWLIIAFLVYFPIPSAAANHYTTVYYGQYTDNSLGDIFSSRPIKYEDSSIAVFAHAATLFPRKSSYQWEIEGQIGKHSGIQNHWEFNIAVIIRRTSFPWNQYIKTTAALGDGLSYASVVPPIELASHTNTGAARLLNYIVMELSFAPPREKHWSLVTRIHHRSGIFGLFDGVKGGSNIMGLGLKYEY